jgi:GntR family transcriptional repressor for pyruvate dehydrogenase complex
MAEEVAEMFAAMSDPADYLVHDVLFHRIISQASGNPILAALMETITSAMYDKRLKTVERSIDMRESAEMHREIYRAVRVRDSLEARRLMEQHLRMAQTSQGMERAPARKTVQGATRPKRAQVVLKASPLEKNVSATAG